MTRTAKTPSILKTPEKLDSPRLQINEKLRVRQYIVSYFPIVLYTECCSKLKTISSADWQDHESSRLQQNTSTPRPLSLVDNHNLFRTDSDYGFDPHWEVHYLNQHHLFFYIKSDKQDSDIENHSFENDRALNYNIQRAG